MKTKILILCTRNLARSPIAKQVFAKRISNISPSSKYEIDTAGMGGISEGAFFNIEFYVNSALERNHYSPIARHKPKVVNRTMASSSDIVFTLSSAINYSLHERWSNLPATVEKVHFLSEYAEVKNISDDIFDPDYLLVSPKRGLTRKHPLKSGCAAFLNMFRGDFASELVYRLTPYIPFTQDGRFREDTIRLYERTVHELEPCIDGAIKRMQKEGLLR